MMKYLLMISIFLYLITTIFPGYKFDMSYQVPHGYCVIDPILCEMVCERIRNCVSHTRVMMLATSDVDLEAYLLSFGPMLNLLTLFAIVPILALPIG